MVTSLIFTTLLSFDQARTEIVSMIGTQYYPVAVQAFLGEESTLREMVAAKCMQLHAADPSRLVNPDGRN